MRGTVLVAVAVLGVALLIWWSTRDPGAPRSAPEKTRATGPRSPEPEPPAPAPETAEAGETAPSVAEAKESDAPPGSFVVPGRVEWVGSEEVPDEVVIVFRRVAEREEVIRAEGRAGRVRARFPASGRYRILDLVVNGRSLSPGWREITVQEGEEIVIRLTKTRATVLVVTDALTGAPLPGARACDGSGAGGRAEIRSYESWRGRIVHGVPRTDPDFAEADASGRIPWEPDRGRVAVIAEGHAWSLVDIARAAGGEIAVELLPGGNVRVRIPRWEELVRPVLRVRLEGWPGEVTLYDGDFESETKVTGLLAGRHELLVREYGGRGRIAGSAEVTVLPGRETDVRIDVEPVADERLEVTGRITIPKAWNRPPTFLTFQRRRKAYDYGESYRTDLDRSEGDAPGSYRYRLEGLKPGTYFVELEPFDYRRKIEVGPGATTFDFDLPGPVEMRLRVVGADTGKELPGAELAWHSSVADLTSYGLQISARAATGAFEFQAPPGMIEVSVSAEGYLEEDVEFEVRGSRVERVIRLRPGSVLLVRFRADGKDFSGEDLWCDLEFERGTYGRSGSPEGIRFPNLEAGEYTLRVEEIAGFAPVPDRKVQVRAGSNEVIVELVRKR